MAKTITGLRLERGVTVLYMKKMKPSAQIERCPKLSTTIHDLIDALGDLGALFDADGRLVYSNVAWRAELGEGGLNVKDGRPGVPFGGASGALEGSEVRAIRLKALWLVVVRRLVSPKVVHAPNPTAGPLIDELAAEASRCLDEVKTLGGDSGATVERQLLQIRLVAQLMAGRPTPARLERLNAVDLVSGCFGLPIAPSPRITLWLRSAPACGKVYGDRLQLLFAMHVFLEAISRDVGEPATILLDVVPHGAFVLIRALSQQSSSMPSGSVPLAHDRVPAEGVISLDAFSWDARRDLAERILERHGARWRLGNTQDEGAFLELPLGGRSEGPSWEAPQLSRYAEDLRRALARRP